MLCPLSSYLRGIKITFFSLRPKLKNCSFAVAYSSISGVGRYVGNFFENSYCMKLCMTMMTAKGENAHKTQAYM